MKNEISKTQIDNLGDRLRKGNITDDDLRLLDEYRRSFTEAYGVVEGEIRGQLGLEPTGRPAKSTTSIAEKLRRESIRLTQIQDIAGCRLVVPAIAEQERVITSLVALFPENHTMDRRQRPSHGYRSVHVIAMIAGKTVEIQVRTALQQLWAEVSEKLSDLVDPKIKYGGGAGFIRTYLDDTSRLIALEEQEELQLFTMKERLSRLASTVDLTQEKREAIITLQEDVHSSEENLAVGRQTLLEQLQRFIEDLPRLVE